MRETMRQKKLDDDLVKAALRGNLDEASRLVEQGAHVDAASWKDQPLHFASANGHRDVVAFLLAKGAKANAASSNGWQPLHYAAMGGYGDVIKLLLEHGADPTAENYEGRTPAALCRNEEFIPLLEEAAARKRAARRRWIIALRTRGPSL